MMMRRGMLTCLKNALLQVITNIKPRHLIAFWKLATEETARGTKTGRVRGEQGSADA